MNQIEELLRNLKCNISIYACDEYSNEIKFNENEIVESASCIKVFILIEYYRQIMNKQKSREDKLIYCYNKDYVAEGSGIIQYLENNLELSSKNLAILMTIVSDNIATGMMIEYLGYDNINQTIEDLGFKNTKLLAPKLDFKKYNKIGITTAKEYADLFKMLLQKTILTEEICEEIITILSHQKSNEMLVKNLPQKCLNNTNKKESFVKYIASKSGGLGDKSNNTISCRNDGGIISTQNGAYIVSIFINNIDDYFFYNDNPAIILGAEINNILFENFTLNKGKFKL